MDLKRLFAVMPYGEEWNKRRRALVHHFPTSNPNIHQSKEIQFIRNHLLPQLVTSSEKFMEHVRQLVPGGFTYPGLSSFMLTSL